MKTIFTCTQGHTHSISEDLGDPADRQQVLRWEEGMRGDKFFWQCPKCQNQMSKKIENTPSDFT
jgi:hypothetical protein